MAWCLVYPAGLSSLCFADVITVSAPGPGGTAGANQNGTASDDTITLENGATAGDVKGRGGDDTIVLESGAQAALVNGNTGTDTITNKGTVTGNLGGGAGDDTITNSGSVTGDLRGGDGDDTIINSGTVSGMIEGQAGSDTIIIESSGQVTGYSVIGGSASSSANSITNEGTVNNIYGTDNTSDGSFGGGNTISNSGSAIGLCGSYNSGDNSGGGSNTITNSGTLSGVAPGIFGSVNAGDSSSGGSNTITNSGTSEGHILGSYNTGDNSSGGGNTIVNTGTINSFITGSHNLGSGSSGGGNTILNSGTVQNIYGSYNGSHASGGGNTITNTGTVTGDIRGSWNFGLGASATGNTIINSGTVGGSIYGGTGDDTVIIQAGSSVAGSVDGQAGTDTLKLESAGRVDGSQYLNFESLSVTGVTTITNTLTIAGDATNTGTLMLNSTLAATSLTNSGFLGGSGTISGNLVNAGTLSPGNSIGTITITGDYTHQATATYDCELAGDGTSDLIQVTGAATLNGGTVSLSNTGVLADGASWTILTAGGGVSGTFTTLDYAGSSLLLNFSLAYNTNDILVTLSRNSYASLAATENQRQVASALDGLIPLAATRSDALAVLIGQMDYNYTLSQIRATLDSLSPEMYDGFTWSAIKGARRFEGIIARQMEGERILGRLGLEGQGSQTGRNLWTRLFGGWARRHGDSGHIGVAGSYNGMAMGVDQPVLPWLTMGIALGGQTVDLDWEDNGFNGDQQTFSTGVYARAGFGGLHLDGSASCSISDSRADRTIASGTTSYKTTGSFKSEAVSGRFAGGYDFQVRNWVAGPLASVQYLILSENAVAETGAEGLTLAVDRRHTDYGTLFLGLGGAARFGTGSRVLVPRIRAGWRHLVTPGSRTLLASFKDYPGSSFTVTGNAPAQDLMSIRIGMDLTLGQGNRTFFQCSADHGGGENTVVLSAGFDWVF